MKTEITVQLFDNLETIVDRLSGQGGSFIEEYRINDFYFSKFSFEEIKMIKYIQLMDKSFILREIIDDKTIAEIVYKNKKLDKNGNVIAEDKLNVNIDDVSKANEIFLKSGLNCWCELKNHSFVYKLGDFELAIQVVKDLGIFLECEETENMKDMNYNEKFEFLKNFVCSLNLKMGKDFSCKKVYMKYLNNINTEYTTKNK